MTDMLYPFLYAGGSGLDTLMEDVRRSTAEKVRDIVRLREAVLEEYGADLADCAARMADAFRSGGRLFTFGNGGSSTDAQDVAALFLNPGGAASPNPGGAARPLPALALTTDVAVVTALSNDVGFEVVFARQLAAFGRPGDIALALSTSGNSDNLIAALREAARRGMVTAGLAGYTGGQMAELPGLHHLFVVPSSSVHRIQEAQTTIYHALWELTQRELTREAV
ncbi:D-sedoheptulose-7-phosphate isomerase [Actinomadura madurae]|uniref:D-sedoheptulose-7-phosphate isomerase n=1 Tax=Actinomadura madurae TaxID=1993 RepID=UPI0020272FE7|nr:SIS domain-containing protein [Actinomadura madurae]MCP9953488.1 SIS domain-containing protein [Actinomadura madurae]MCP9970248.1 SIS domain-containing protein [Actinomadura madurae]MCP9982715.1 SIS domain-containing protein [Actinomadura madurae]URM98977.1 SIS domain-containing protein [Actinomadura madurae]URN09668.1 SIS domain-containing protein [Actinomadura madurae]